jgi:hypothetical protein
VGGCLLGGVRPLGRVQRLAADPGRVRPGPVDQPSGSNGDQPSSRRVGHPVDGPLDSSRLGGVLQRLLAVAEIAVPAQQRPEDVRRLTAEQLAVGLQLRHHLLELGVQPGADVGGQCLVGREVVTRRVTPGLRVRVDQDDVLHRAS